MKMLCVSSGRLYRLYLKVCQSSHNLVFSGVDFQKMENVLQCSSLLSCTLVQGKLSNLNQFYRRGDQ